MENNIQYCNQCGNHCPVDDLKCGRGRTFFGQGNKEEHNHSHGKQLTGIAGLLKQCGHMMHHNQSVDNDTLCKGLSLEEQNQFESLLQKVLNNVK